MWRNFKPVSYTHLDVYKRQEPGYVIAVSPEAGSVAKSGDTVTLTVSRGLDWGEGALVPSVVGKKMCIRDRCKI